MEQDWIKKIKKKELCSFFGEISIPTKSITLFAGENTIGKTATCIHISKFAIENNFSVLYFDTEKKLIDRPEPNLLNVFLHENMEGFKNHFFVEHKLFDAADKIDLSYLEAKVKEKKPDLVVIDSIYTPFSSSIPHSMARAKAIGEFMRNLREFMINQDIAIIITTKIGKVTKGEKEGQAMILGGQELLYNCDTKARMDIMEGKLKEKKIRFDVDMQKEFVLVLDYGGHLRKVK